MDRERLIELEEGEMWNDYLEEVNGLLHDEKAARHENDASKLTEICSRIVSGPFLHSHSFFGRLAATLL